MITKEPIIPLVRDVSYDRDVVPLLQTSPHCGILYHLLIVSFVNGGNLKWGGIFPIGNICENIPVILRNITDREY